MNTLTHIMGCVLAELSAISRDEQSEASDFLQYSCIIALIFFSLSSYKDVPRIITRLLLVVVNLCSDVLPFCKKPKNEMSAGYAINKMSEEFSE